MFIDFIKEALLPLLLIILVFCIVLFGPLFVVDYFDCKSFGNVTGHETKYSFGCYAKVDGRFVPKEFVYGTANELRIKNK